MKSTSIEKSPPSARTRAAAVTMAVMSVGYLMLSVFYFYEDFFKYLGHDAATYVDRTGWLVSVDGVYLWSILSPWRLLGAVLAIVLLAASAAALWNNRARARTLALITLWGVLLPQVLWYTEFVVDWHHGQGLFDVVMLALFACAIPTMLLAEFERPLVDLKTANAGRLVAFAVACGWIAFAATAFIDHSYQLMSSTAYLGALIAIPLAALAIKGIYNLRAWGLWAGVASAIALAMVPLAASWTGYMPTGEYSNNFHAAAAGSDIRIALAMLIPLAAVWALAAPFLHGFIRKLRG